MASIVLIDDDRNVRSMTAEELCSDCHTLDTAIDGDAGLTLQKSRTYSPGFREIVMPDMNGLQFIEELRKSAPKPRVIAISGGSEFSRPVSPSITKCLRAERILAKRVPSVVLSQPA